MIRVRRTGVRLSGVLGLATLLAVGVAVPVNAQPGTRKTDQKKQSVSRNDGGQQAAAGQATAKSQKPAAQDAQQMAADLAIMLQRDVENMNVVTLPDGTMTVDLDGSFQNVMIATFDANGQLVVNCVDDLATAETLLQSKLVGRIKTKGNQKESGKKSASKRAPVAAEEK